MFVGEDVDMEVEDDDVDVLSWCTIGHDDDRKSDLSLPPCHPDVLGKLGSNNTNFEQCGESVGGISPPDGNLFLYASSQRGNIATIYSNSNFSGNESRLEVQHDKLLTNYTAVIHV